MAEEDTTEELPVAYRRLGRRPDGRMGVIYYDEDGNLIDYADLENYRVNEISNDPVGSDETEPDEPEAPSGPSGPATAGRTQPQEPSDGMNPAHAGSGAALVDPSTGREPVPYTGPNEWQGGHKIAEWLGNSKFVERMQNFGTDRVEPLTEKAANFMREQEARRQRLAEQGIQTAEEVEARPEAVANPDEPRPVQIQTITPESPVATAMPQEEWPGQNAGYQLPIDAPYVPMDIAKGPPTGSSFVDAALSAPPGENGGASPEIKEQISQGMSPGQVRDQQLAEQEIMTQRERESGIPGIGRLEDMGSVPDVREVNVVSGNTGIPEVNRHTENITPEVEQAIQELADDLGLPAHEVGGIIGTETADKFSPSVDNGFGFRGAIQFDAHNQDKYGKMFGKDLSEMTFKEQLEGPVRQYLSDRGFRPGMTAEQLYTTIHAGRPNVGMHKKDFANGLTTKQIYDSHIKPRQASYKKYIESQGRAPGPQAPAPRYDPYSPVPTETWGGSESNPWGGLSGGNLSSDPRLGGYGFSNAVDPSSNTNTNPGFTAPRLPGGTDTSGVPIGARTVPTSTVHGFGGGNLGGFGPSATSFSGGSSSGDRDGGSVSSGSGVGSQGRSNPSSGGTTASRESTVGGYQEYANSRNDPSSRGNNNNSSPAQTQERSDGGNPGNDSGGGRGSSSERGSGQSGGAGGGGGSAGSTGNTSHGSEADSQAANDAGMGSLGGGGGWF